MPPNRHAVLSASSSHRWLHCNPSARLELEFEDRETEAAAEGTAAHALAEHKLRKALKMRSTRPVSKYDSDEMEMYTDGYLEFVLEAIEEARQARHDMRHQMNQLSALAEAGDLDGLKAYLAKTVSRIPELDMSLSLIHI